MSTANRITRSFSLDRNVVRQIERSKGAGSASGRVNQLLKAALEAESRQSLHDEAAAFFHLGSPAASELELRDDFHFAGLATLIRDED